MSIKNPYAVGAESLTIEEKLKVLEEMGRPELISVFKEWQPRQTRRRKSGAPLDQKVAVSVTSGERAWLEGEIRAIKAASDSVSMSQYVRDQAMATVDIEQWKLTATSELERLDDIESHRKDLEKKREALIYMTEDTDDEEELALYNRQLYTVKHDLEALAAKPGKRGNRLSGRMSMAEAETVRWRASRLCLSTSDYLRMVIFNLGPASIGDSHLGLDSRRRFYISIIDVANNGWGHPSTVYECSQCANYIQEIEKLRDRISQLERFV